MTIRSKILLYFSTLSIGIVGIAFIIIYSLFSNYRTQEFQQRIKDKTITTVKFLVEIEQIDHNLMPREAECEDIQISAGRVGDPGLVKCDDLIDENQPQSEAPVLLTVFAPEKMLEEKLLFVVADNLSGVDYIQA